MKKIYILISCVLVGSVATGQTPESTTEIPSHQKVAMERSNTGPQTAGAISTSREDIYTEDFDGGIPGDWAVETESGPCSWEWTDEGHQGEYPSPSLQSTTADNGWMILDSDNCGTSGGGVEISYLTGPSVDLSDYPAVSVRFEQYFRRYGPANEVTSLEVSVDGGEWVSYVFNTDITQDGTDNPDIAQVNISDIAGGQSDVQFRFRWEGEWGYGWQIDDFTVFVPEDNDLTLSNTDYQYEWISADEETYRDLPYSVYPISQLRELNFRGKITNNGALTQTGVMLEVNIVGPDGYDVTFTSTAVDLAPADTAILNIADYMPEAVTGEYTVTFTAVQEAEDDNPDDNIRSTSFQVSEAEYARDRGVSEGEFSNYDDDYKLGTAYYMENTETLHCVGVALSSSSTPGTSYNLELLDAFDFAYLAESEFTEVPPVENLNDAGDSNWHWTWMASPQVLTEGLDYMVVLNHFGGADPVTLRVSGTSAAQTSFLYEGSEETWYYVTSTPMVRIGLSSDFCISVIPTGIDEPGQVTMDKLFPNPSEGQTTLEYALLEKSDVQLMLFDQQGRIVMQENKGTQPVGEYRFDYDFSHLASGMYTFSIQVDDKAINKKLVIK